MKVIVIEPGKNPEVKEISLALGELQKLVGGLIEVSPIGKGYYFIVNEEGKLDDLPPNFIHPMTMDIIVGTAVVVKDRVTECGEREFGGLNDEDINFFLKWCNKFIRIQK